MATSRLRALLKVASTEVRPYDPDRPWTQHDQELQMQKEYADQWLIENRDALALLVLGAVGALERRVSEQSGHFLNCPAHDEIVQWGEAKVGSCACADDLAILARLAEVEATLPEEVPYGGGSL